MKRILIPIIILVSACNSTEPKKDAEELFPLTAANMRGHKHLYEDGWLIVSSTEKSIAYANQHMLDKSQQSFIEGGADLSSAGRQFVKGVERGGRDTGKFLNRAAAFGVDKTAGVFIITNEIAKDQITMSRWLVEQGGVTLWEGARKWPGHAYNAGKAITMLPKNIAVDTYDHVNHTVSSTNAFNDKVWMSAGDSWQRGLGEAADAHRSGVKAGQQSNNSFVAIFPVMWGNIKSAYYAIAKPTAHTVIATAATAGSYGVYLPVSTVAGAAWYSSKHSANTAYAVGELAYRTMAPPITSIALGAGGAVTAATVPVTYMVGSTAGVAAGVGITVGSVAGSTAYVNGNTSWELVNLTGKGMVIASWRGGQVVFNQVSSVVVLGYNATTALPTHGLMVLTDAMCLAIYDAPHAIYNLAKG